MKKIFKIIGIVVAVIYSIIAITLTAFLLNYNKYHITVINDNSFIKIKDNEMEPDYKKGDLIIVKKNPNKDIVIGDKIFFYEGQENNVTVNLGRVIGKEDITQKETTFTINGNHPISSEYVIGKASTSKIYHNLGGILSILESKFGFLFLIIFPILILFIYEIFVVIKEIKSPDEE